MHVMSNKTISVSHRSTDEVIVWGEALTQSRVIGLFPKLHHFQVEILVSRC